MAEDSGSSQINPWDIFSQALKRVETLIKKSGTQHINSAHELAEIKNFLLIYFRQLRHVILSNKLETEAMDQYFENLQSISSKRSYRSAYVDLLKKIRKKFLELEIRKEYSASNIPEEEKKEIEVSDIENKILKTLEKINPAVAGSYMQLLIDINDFTKTSFKGTVHELREVLRETLARLAPDSEVEASKGFKLESNCNKPTMRQKVLFIFSQRGSSKDEKDIAISSVTPIELSEDAIAEMTRTVYVSGSTSAHTGAKNMASIRGQIIQLKMYLDAVLSHLLEINKGE